MIFREATFQDIPQMQVVRRVVRENVLPDPGLIADADYEIYLRHCGKGWICESKKKVLGFAIADLTRYNIWALFVRPEFEHRGIGRKLHEMMMDWYFSQTKETAWLGTAPLTRAAGFYKKAGWKESGMHGNKEIRFEMTWEQWAEARQDSNGL